MSKQQRRSLSGSQRRHESRDMTRFIAEPMPSPRAAQVELLEPNNAFATAAYAAARQSLGSPCWLFGLESAGRLLTGCFGFTHRGRVNHVLEIPSVPGRGGTDFYLGLLDFCRRERVTGLDLGSYSSAGADIPRLPRESARRSRLEWILDVSSEGASAELGDNHRRSIARARKLGVTSRCTTDNAAVTTHCQLMEFSLTRRAARGEAIDVGREAAEAFARSAMEAGAAEIHQACLSGAVVASVLLLRARRGAYYYSAGNSPEGMQSGASAFLIRSIANTLADHKADTFNLGDAGPDNPGLYRFKSGFGARAVALEAARACPFTLRRTPMAAVLYFGRQLLGAR